MTRARDPLLTLIRGVMVLLGGLVGYAVSTFFFPPDSLNRIYVTILGALLISLFVGQSSLWVRDAIRNLVDAVTHAPPKTILAVTVATIAALLISVLLSNILSSVPGYGWYFQVGITLLLESILVTVAVSNQELFAPVAARNPTMERNSNSGRELVVNPPKVLDTSVIIDGRILEVVQTGFLEGPFIVPSFVLRELQYFADQSDAIKRAKGRRGLDLLEKMRTVPGSEFLVRDYNEPEDNGKNTMAVDDRLVRAAQESNAILVTNDSGLTKVASLQNVRCLSLNALAEALKPRHGAGDEITITVMKEGSQPGQGIGYLEDGTMVVIEDGMALRGRTVKVNVVSNIQTALGRMIFAKPKEVL
jgi:uncharacterized protein YacL